MTEPRSEYAQVTPMFERLKTLPPGSPAYRAQRDAIISCCLPLADHIARRFKNRGEEEGCRASHEL